MRRREFMTSMGALPFLPGLLPAAGKLRGTDRALILLWMDGGMSHLDTFDGKPEAPPGVRGQLDSAESAREGVFVSEGLPRLSALMDRLSLVRSITSPEGNHDRGSHYMLTGRRPSPVLTYPSFGSVFGQDLAAENPVPPYVAIPAAHTYARQGFLPATCAPFEIGGEPGKPGFKVRDLDPPPGMRQALDLLERVDALDGAPRSDSERARDRFLEQARYLSLDPEARALFDLGAEAPEVRGRYGRHFLGESCLLARRLVEGGVRTVLVRWTGWDHHVNIKNALTYGFPPRLQALDQAVSALYEDLGRRGLLGRTTVLLASEFGRTPRINPAGGRDHWPRASSALLFGAGIAPGAVVGKTDPRGEEPAERPVSPAALFQTVLAALQVDPGRVLHTPDGRPVRLGDETYGPVRDLLA